MSVRAKLFLSAITDSAFGGKIFRFETRYDSTIPGDQVFSKATPSGHAEFMIDNPAALAQFKLGEYYFVDFTPVPLQPEKLKTI